MDAAALVEAGADPAPPSHEAACPRCAEPARAAGPVRAAFLPGAELWRCSHCGARFGGRGGEERLLLTCSRCELPYLATGGGAPDSCPDCLAGRVPDDLPHAALAAATEEELLSALEAHWGFVTSEASAVYLDTLLRRVARQIDGAPRDCRVVLFEETALKTLALPSGTILLSQETLEDLDDEAQLVFVLAHELVHAARHARERLIRIGLRTVARDEAPREIEDWAEMCEDIVRLGFGRRREAEADARALEAVLALGYDPDSVIRYFRHLEVLAGRADERALGLLLAHATPGERIRRADAALRGRVDSGTARLVNREVLRRATRRHASAVTRASLAGLLAEPANGADPAAQERPRSLLPWAAAAVAVLAALVVALALFF